MNIIKMKMNRRFSMKKIIVLTVLFIYTGGMAFSSDVNFYDKYGSKTGSYK